MEEVIQKELLHELVTDLEQKIADNSIQTDDFKTALYQLKEAKYKILGLLDLLQDSDEEIRKLYRSASNESYADLIDDLNSLGYRYRSSSKKNEVSFTNDITNMGYRIMEQVRIGKRDSTFYTLLRIYMSNNISFDRKLLFAFKHPNNEMFKVLVFSFLSGIIREKTGNQD